MKTFRIAAVIITMLLLVASLPLVAAAAPAPQIGSTDPAFVSYSMQPEPPDPTNLVGVLQWLIAGGAGIIATMLTSELAEHWPWFGGLAANGKRWFMIGASVMLALIPWAILTYVPREILDALAVPFGVAATAVLAYLMGQVYHKSTKDEQRIYMDSAPVERIGPQSLRR